MLLTSLISTFTTRTDHIRLSRLGLTSNHPSTSQSAPSVFEELTANYQHDRLESLRARLVDHKEQRLFPFRRHDR